jgi:hypothetical protein
VIIRVNEEEPKDPGIAEHNLWDDCRSKETARV